jgi:hypothetical protein
VPGAGYCDILRRKFSTQAFYFMPLLSERILQPGYCCVEDRILRCDLLELVLSLRCHLLITLERSVTGKARTKQEHNEEGGKHTGGCGKT